VLALGCAFVPERGANAATDPLQAAEQKITEAKVAAQRATAAYDQAQAELAQIDNEITKTKAEVARLTAERDRLAKIARNRAVAAYIRPSVTIDEMVGSSDMLAAARRTELLDGANAQSNKAIHKLEGVTDDLHAKQRQLDKRLERQQSTVEQMRAKQTAMQAALQAAVKAEQELRKRLELEKKLREYAQRLARARAAARLADPTIDTPGIVITTGDWVCPVQGAVSFSDSWGAPRSGGRRHKGIDMFAESGTPLVAVTKGDVWYQSDPLGGLAAYVDGDDGNSYYYAHLLDYVGRDRAVKAGELIGHVGATGNADGDSPHLHFEIRPGGATQPAIPPYPTIAEHC
jgi:murein DD-endopeptidase MepM/ murein hydrolase activator NlpD